MKILCCGFFPALQRTIEFASFRHGEVNRARKVSVAVGGKAANAARVLKLLGAEPQLLSFAGGGNGDTVRALLDAEQLPACWVETKAETRICQTLLSADTGGCTELVEENPPLSASEWKAFIKTFAAIQSDFDRIIFSGNLPKHAPQDVYAELLSRTGGEKVLIDSSGAPLLAALEQRPAVVKLNAEELRATFKSTESITELAEELMAQGAGAVGVTQGKDEARLFLSGEAYAFSIPQVNALNPIGSGDAVNAGISYALANGHSLVEAFVFGLACGTSNAMNMEPGVVSLEQIADIARQIQILG
ncbi:MAG: 1-phosphofructokinase family hexose kinase [Pontiellaceae bacterium]|jgi:tagatose 6-phosphate kinase|nr:1-phosphofructokinase family hexose kinase [Pontiellaceae bacterium]